MKDPQLAVKKFFNSWKHKEFKMMSRACQKTWFSKFHGDMKAWDWIKHNYGNKTLLRFEIDSVIYTNEVVCDISIKMEYVFADKNYQRVVIARCICERGAYKTHPKGKWGVNPISTLREHTMEEIKAFKKKAEEKEEAGNERPA